MLQGRFHEDEEKIQVNQSFKPKDDQTKDQDQGPRKLDQGPFVCYQTKTEQVQRRARNQAKYVSWSKFTTLLFTIQSISVCTIQNKLNK